MLCCEILHIQIPGSQFPGIDGTSMPTEYPQVERPVLTDWFFSLLQLGLQRCTIIDLHIGVDPRFGKNGAYLPVGSFNQIEKCPFSPVGRMNLSGKTEKSDR